MGDPTGLSLAAAHHAIAARIPDRDALVWRGRTWSWAEVADRTARLATVLRDHGVGPVAAPAPEPWASPHQHLALVLLNGNAYLEGMVGAARARAAAINVNWRYTAPEMAEVLDDAAAAAVAYHGRYAVVVAEAVDRMAVRPRLLLRVDDGSGDDLLPGALDYEAALAAADPAPPDPAWSGDDRYVLYTGGTTGRPKGVLWRQADFLATCLGITATHDELVAAAGRDRRLRALPAPPFMHGAAHWNALSAWMGGGTVLVQDVVERFDPADVLDTCAREGATSLLVVGDAFARPLVAELRARPRELPLRHLLTGGTVLSSPVKADLLELVPGLQIVDVLGSSETGRQAITRAGGAGPATGPTTEGTPARTTAVGGGTTDGGSGGGAADGPVEGGPSDGGGAAGGEAGGGGAVAGRGAAAGGGVGAARPIRGSFRPEPTTVVVSEDRTRVLSPEDRSLGWLAQGGRVPLGYLGDPAKTAATFPQIEGARYAVAGDRAHWTDDGRIELLGREAACINTGGEKVFAEEVERALAHHPGVADCLVVGRPHERFGQEIVAVAALRPGVPVDLDALRTVAAAHLAPYKLPRALVTVEAVHRSPSGKPDYAWARDVAVAATAPPP